MRSWQLIHGDSLDALKDIKAGAVDAIVTDPPYCSGGRQQAGARNTISKSERTDGDWFIGDNMGTDTYLWFMREIARQCARVTTTGAPAYVFTDWRQMTTIVNAWESVGWTYKSLIVWDKNRGGAMGSWWRNNHEFICAFVKGKARPLSSASFFNTWRGSKPHGSAHPTEKPVELMRYLCSSITPAGCVVLDPFAGSGTTGVAALMDGYQFIGVEQSGDYIEVAKARLLETERSLGLDLV
jgi:site-specific DNA-methyltransferase (adenine-specific)